MSFEQPGTKGYFGEAAAGSTVVTTVVTKVAPRGVKLAPAHLQQLRDGPRGRNTSPRQMADMQKLGHGQAAPQSVVLPGKAVAPLGPLETGLGSAVPSAALAAQAAPGQVQVVSGWEQYDPSRMVSAGAASREAPA